MNLLNRLLIDTELFELDVPYQRIVVWTSSVLGLPLSIGFIIYDAAIGRYTEMAFLAALSVTLASILVISLLGIDERKKFITIKLFFILFILVFGFIMVYMIAVKMNITRVPWAYLVPITSFYALGTRLSIPLMIAFIAGMFWALLSVPLDPVLHRSDLELLTRVLVTLPISCAVSFLSFHVLRRHQRVQIRSKASLEQSEKRHRESNEKLTLEVNERKRYENELKRSLDEKEMLLKELHHRVKNNLQIVSSLLNLEGMKTDDPAVLYFMHNSQRRIQTIQLVHEMLYTSKEIGRIDFGAYLENIVSNIHLSLSTGDCNVTINIDVPGVAIDIDTAITSGLIVNELVTNAMKHAFTGRSSGVIDIRFTENDADCVLSLADNGLGMPPEGYGKKSDSFGMSLIDGLVKQLGGEMEIDATRGTAYTFRFVAGSRFKVYPIGN